MGKLMSTDEAVNLIKPGNRVCLGGFMIHNHPMALIRAIIRSQVCDLSLMGPPSSGPDADMLLGAGVVSEIRLPSVMFDHLGIAPAYRRVVEEGLVEVFEYDEASVTASLRASAEGLPFYPVGSLFGSDILKANPEFREFSDPIDGKRLTAVPPFNPDIALIHVQEADELGNCRLFGSHFLDPLMARAAKKTILTTDRIITEEDIRRRPQDTAISSIHVAAVVEARFGAHPCSSHGLYSYDEEHLRAYAQQAKTKEGFAAYVEKYCTPDHRRYLEKIGEGKLDSLRGHEPW
jgi:glutaconate CoA-transferase subunit A